MDSGNNLFEPFLNDNSSENSREYTLIQSTINECYEMQDTELTELTINNSPSTSNSSNISQDNNCRLTIEDKTHLKSMLDDWNMGYLYKTCVGKLK